MRHTRMRFLALFLVLALALPTFAQNPPAAAPASNRPVAAQPASPASSPAVAGAQAQGQGQAQGQVDPRLYQAWLQQAMLQQQLMQQYLLQQQQGWRGMAGLPYSYPPPYGYGGEVPGYLTSLAASGGQSLPGYGGQAGQSNGGQQSGGQGQQGMGQGQQGQQGQPGGQAQAPAQGQTPPASSSHTLSTVEGLPAQPAPRPEPFPVPLFKMDHVVRKLDISREQFDNLTTMTAQLQARYLPEFDKISALGDNERQSRHESLLRVYSSEWAKAAADILHERQLAEYRDLAENSLLP